ncbi:MAG TPA: glucose-6-phosphate dehydrogenase, partial [Gemmatimonadaceae bacterium]|nr:glucose-6-phosphate dehydrogenase [Gemmatimonadaceae bacterium]
GAAQRVRRPRGEGQVTAPSTPKMAVRHTTQFGEVGARHERAEQCTMVIFGATGDLTKRKLFPALYQLAAEHLLSPTFAVLCVGRDDTETDDSFRQKMRAAVQDSDEVKRFDDELWRSLASRTFYVGGDATDAGAYNSIKRKLAEIEQSHAEGQRNRFFYLAVPPSVFEPIVRHLSESGLVPRHDAQKERPWARVVVEKPFGHSLETARTLNALVLSLFAEHQVYRIDHYLGKETVQNVLVFRFANSIFEPLWNRRHIAHVQITAAEEVGVEARGKYYEEAGVVRDMFQNHLLQLLALTAMEPPSSMTADAVRDEKVKVLRSIRWLTPESIPTSAVRAQYAPGTMRTKSVVGYREEPDVAKESTTPTFAAARFYIDNWRWQGVPFYVRSGKRLGKRVSEIAVQFHEPPHLMFGGAEGQAPLQPNTLVIRVQPNEGISLSFEVKVPGAAVAMTQHVEVAPVEMDFTYAEAFGETAAPAYQTLLLDVMIGEMTLFLRSDEVEAAWKIIDPLICYWESHAPSPMATYPSGSWGPAEADALIAADGAAWRTP